MDPLAVPFARRALKRVDEAVPGEHEFSVVTYNILADCSLQMNSKEGKAYSYCPKEFKISKQERKAPRHTLFMEELRWLNGDIICLQEVDTPYFEEILANEMDQMGYKGLFAPRCKPGRPEGVALFFKRALFELIENKTVYVDDLAARIFSKQEGFPSSFEVVLLTALKHKSSNNLLVIGTTHIIWGKLLKTVFQVYEISFVACALAAMVAQYESRYEHVSHILCGDFNIEPQFPAYKFLKEGKLKEKEMKELGSVEYIIFPPDIEHPSQLKPDQMSLLSKAKEHFHHPLKNLESAYKAILGVEPQCTNHEGPGCVWTLDYIWFDSANLKATAALETVSKTSIEPYTGLPNQFYPSDHLSLKAHFKFSAS